MEKITINTGSFWPYWYKRIDRRNSDPNLSSGKMGAMELFDNEMKAYLRLNDKEYDFFCGFVNEDNSKLLFSDGVLTFKQKRELLLWLEDILREFYQRGGMAWKT